MPLIDTVQTLARSGRGCIDAAILALQLCVRCSLILALVSVYCLKNALALNICRCVRYGEERNFGNLIRINTLWEKRSIILMRSSDRMN